MFSTHHNIMIRVSENPPYSLKSEASSDCVQSRTLFVLQYLEIAISSSLFGLVKSLNNYSDTSFIAWILRIVSIKKSHSLLLMTSRKPVAYKILNLGNIHELNIIDVPELLTFDDDIWRNTFVAHCFGVGFVVFAGTVNLISHL